LEEKKSETTLLHMAATGHIVELKEDNSPIFKKPRVLGSRESSQRVTNDNDQVDSIGGSTNTISSRNVALMEMFNPQCKEEVEDVVVEFFFANGISFNATHSPLYKETMKKVIIVYVDERP
jgi:hypothetical protein